MQTSTDTGGQLLPPLPPVHFRTAGGDRLSVQGSTRFLNVRIADDESVVKIPLELAGSVAAAILREAMAVRQVQADIPRRIERDLANAGRRQWVAAVAEAQKARRAYSHNDCFGLRRH